MRKLDKLKELEVVSEISHLFEILDEDHDGIISAKDLKAKLYQAGFYYDTPQTGGIFAFIERKKLITKKDFNENESVFKILDKIANKKLIINKFDDFTVRIQEIYEKSKDFDQGNVATYIPQLARVNPEYFAVSICTIDGQTYHIGDTDMPFSVQSTSKAINYALSLEEHGSKFVHGYVGEEPSGRGFNELTFNYKGLPFNPLTNAGGIMCCSMIHNYESLASRLEFVINRWKELSGGGYVGFDAPTYLSEQETGHRNFAIGYLMKEKNIFPKGTDLLETLNFYFQCCSIQVNSDTLAAVGATFANGGVCPQNNQRIITAESATNCLTLMYSCGLYDFSGEFAFYVGVPAKSGVSGCLLVVIPRVMGIGIYSPRIDRMGNSIRAVEFCKELVRIFSFHNWDQILNNPNKIDPTH